MPRSQFINPAKIRRFGKITFSDIPVNAYQKNVREEKENFTKDSFMGIYYDMAILREFETMLHQIKIQSHYNGIHHTYPGPAHLSRGQEAASVGQAYLLTPGDIIFGSHRSHGEVLAKSLSCIRQLPDDDLLKIMENFHGGKILKVVEGKQKTNSVKELAVDFLIYGMAAEIFARDTGFNMGLGGSMHVFFLPFGVYPNNSIAGASGPIALGAALYKKCNNQKGIVIANLGDGSLGCGPVWESMNFASMDQFKRLWDKKGGLPLLYNFINNGYGMSGQTRGETMGYDFLARVGAGITPNQMHAERIDGYNPLAVIDAYRRKKEILERGEGPALLDVITYRQYGHTPSDANVYREKGEIDAWAKIDPLFTYREALIQEGIAANAEFDKLWKDVRETVEKLTKLARDKNISPYVNFRENPRILENLMFSNKRCTSFSNAKPCVTGSKDLCSRVKQISLKERSAYKEGNPVPKIKTFNYRDALFEPIIDKFYEDSTFIAYGEDVRELGGAFSVYRGLHEVIPYSRLFNTPISEAAIVGSAVGYAMSGGRVLIEIMYADFIGRAGDELFNQLAKWQALSAGALKMPVVVRISVGSKYGPQHSQDWTALAAHIPGLKVCFPATPYEAKGLMQTALNGTDPVIFFESQRLYDIGEKFQEGGVPRDSYEIDIGTLSHIRQGSDLTILTVGAALYRAVKAGDVLSEKYNISVEILNLHSLVPLDYEKIIESIKKTGKGLLISDACTRGSFLNDIARNITELAFDYLDAPVVVAGAQNWITPPYEFEEEFFPQETWILDAINDKILPLPGHTPSVNNYTSTEQMRRAKAGV